MNTGSGPLKRLAAAPSGDAALSIAETGVGIEEDVDFSKPFSVLGREVEDDRGIHLTGREKRIVSANLASFNRKLDALLRERP